MRTTLVQVPPVPPPVPIEEPLPSTLGGWLQRFSRMMPDEIASVLATFKVKGTPRRSDDCGFAVFFRKVLGEHIRFQGRCVHDFQGCHHLPQSCIDFICAFDHGRYPFLVRDGWFTSTIDPVDMTVSLYTHEDPMDQPPTVTSSVVWAAAGVYNMGSTPAGLMAAQAQVCDMSDIEKLVSMFKVPAELVGVS